MRLNISIYHLQDVGQIVSPLFITGVNNRAVECILLST